MRGIMWLALMWVFVLLAWPVHYLLGIPAQVALVLVGWTCGGRGLYLLSQERKT